MFGNASAVIEGLAVVVRTASAEGLLAATATNSFLSIWKVNLVDRRIVPHRVSLQPDWGWKVLDCYWRRLIVACPESIVVVNVAACHGGE